MKRGSPTSWISRTHLDPSQLSSDHLSHQQPLTPTYTSPRIPPNIPKSGFKLLHSVFNRSPIRIPSSNSIRSVDSSSTLTNHPYATMLPAPLPVVSSQDVVEDEEDCPVCLEPLSFSFRLPGEKPHIVPECGHALHEVR